MHKFSILLRQDQLEVCYLFGGCHVVQRDDPMAAELATALFREPEHGGAGWPDPRGGAGRVRVVIIPRVSWGRQRAEQASTFQTEEQVRQLGQGADPGVW